MTSKSQVSDNLVKYTAEGRHWKIKKIPTWHLTSTHAYLTTLWTSHTTVMFDETTLINHHHPKSIFTWGFMFVVVHSIDSDKWHILLHCSFIQNRFDALKILGVHPRWILTTTNLFIVFIVLTFPECHIVEIIILWWLFRLASFT